MRYSEMEFPLAKFDIMLSSLHDIWEKGWLDEYSENHFLIRAIRRELHDIKAERQLKNNRMFYYPGQFNINSEDFSVNFCINFSFALGSLIECFGETSIKNFVVNQLSAGKSHYNEDTFYEALSEVSILRFFIGRAEWNQYLYEPALHQSSNRKNPEASFILDYKDNRKIRFNIEVKSPKFLYVPDDIDKPTLIPAILLSREGRQKFKEFCDENSIRYVNPRVMKLKDFINSAADKFTEPKEDEYNLLYINWSYSEFPSDGFLEAWGLLMNPINGLMTHEYFAQEIGISEDAFKKISAIIVYTEALDGLMFSDFKDVWIRHGGSTCFRMIINPNEKDIFTDDIYKRRLEILGQVTAMYPSIDPMKYVLFSYHTRENIDKSNTLIDDIYKLIERYSLREDS